MFFTCNIFKKCVIFNETSSFKHTWSFVSVKQINSELGWKCIEFYLNFASSLCWFCFSFSLLTFSIRCIHVVVRISISNARLWSENTCRVMRFFDSEHFMSPLTRILSSGHTHKVNLMYQALGVLILLCSGGVGMINQTVSSLFLKLPKILKHSFVCIADCRRYFRFFQLIITHHC